MIPDPSPNRHRSRFGGLWPDLSNAAALIEGKRGLGQLSEEDASAFRFWVEHGYWVIPGAVAPEICDACVADADRVYQSGKDCRVEIFLDGKRCIIPPRPEHKSLPHKLLDLYSVSEAARRAVFSDPIVRFLRLLFERPFMAFQSLSFEWGSGQPLHQDTAYVRVSSPLEFAASWIALEDIREGSGELEYLDGSHGLPDYLFEGRSKWIDWEAPPEQNREYLAYLVREGENRKMERRRFLPRKGDALIWAADLAHGGSSVEKKFQTRRSLVTHYCPTDVEPFYFRNKNFVGPLEYSSGLYYAHPRHQ